VTRSIQELVRWDYNGQLYKRRPLNQFVYADLNRTSEDTSGINWDMTGCNHARQDEATALTLSAPTSNLLLTLRSAKSFVNSECQCESVCFFGQELQGWHACRTP
jgi:hypothetical protein